MKIEPTIEVTVDPKTFDASLTRFGHGGMMVPVATNCPLSIELTKRFGVSVGMGFNRFNVYPAEGDVSRLTYAAADADGADTCRAFTNGFNAIITRPQTPESIAKFRSQLPKTFTFNLVAQK